MSNDVRVALCLTSILAIYLLYEAAQAVLLETIQ